MAYTTINKPDTYFNTVLYNGSASTQNITGVNFQPDLVWIKNRSGASAESHQLVDQVRGATKALMSNETSAEATYANGLSAFLSDGFTLPGGNNRYSDSGYTYVSWNWLAGGTASSNTDGSITSSVSANTTSGFSIVSWTGAGSAGTIGHGLGAVPKFIITKKRNNAGNWACYHSSLGNTQYIYLNSTNASATSSGFWNNTTPTSTLISLGTDDNVTGNGDNIIAYCFADVKGFSKFGSYVGNGSANGAFIYTGFKPAFVIIKRTDGIDWWGMWDTKRNPSNAVDKRIYAQTSGTEQVITNLDIYSNGFKLRTTDGAINASGGNYIYMTFAENALVTTSGVPATAR